MEGKWLSVLEFASYKGKSISTVRRYIKANRVKFKEENGKYFIWTKNYISSHTADQKVVIETKFELERLRKENQELKEELAEARMLLELYEKGKMGIQKKTLPELPADL